MSGAHSKNEDPGWQVARYEQILSAFHNQRMLVLGDVMLDCYLRGDAKRVSPEAPVLVVEVGHSDYAAGGAANVAVNLAGLGARVSLLGVIGEDEEGRQLCRILGASGVSVEGVLIDQGRPTTLKTRIIARGQHIARIDRESSEPISRETMRTLIDRALPLIQQSDVLVISDYAKGVTRADLLREVICVARKENKQVVVDPKGLDYTKYAGTSVLMLNERDLHAIGCPNALNGVLSAVVQRLLCELGCDAIIVTRAERGMLLFERCGRTMSASSTAREVRDVAGAGDSALAVLALCLVAGASLEDATRLANAAAGLVVGKAGTSTVSLADLRAAAGISDALSY